MQFESVIGLEVHTQLKTKTKIFCGCSTEFGAAPNTHTCPVCLGMPGVLPVLNRKVVELTLKMALATGCQIARLSRFARKNYFYPDLPKGYQISQYELPIAEHGSLPIEIDGQPKTIGITRIHMEEDAGKLIHDQNHPISRVDLNRTGVPLIEIVSEPDLRSPEEAGDYLRRLHALVRYLDISDGNMEEGSFRCDANISLRPHGLDTLGTRTEIKNLNSFKNVEKALHYEIVRQKEILMDGGKIIQETRLWDPDRGRTNSMRGKEEAHDYRYFPDPDLLPLEIDEDWVERLQKELPELPEAKKERFMLDLGLSAYDADVLTADKELADYFDACLTTYHSPKQICNWIMGPLLGWLKAQGKTISPPPISPSHLAQLVQLIENGTISGKIAKTVFELMPNSAKSPKQIVREEKLVQVTDTKAIDSAIATVIENSPNEVQRYIEGEKKLLGFFVGQVMKATKGKANPKLVNERLRYKLEAK
jgi:aspartyl-tRNA(Asn)/glutamyl-tRNA(Gln) amidotransferase subunit B